MDFQDPYWVFGQTEIAPAAHIPQKVWALDGSLRWELDVIIVPWKVVLRGTPEGELFCAIQPKGSKEVNDAIR